ncbi:MULTISPECIES: hypothetical protein [Desulfobacula]|uniref:Uncharacterized protein n=1 Tax=Desulfobacula phenolica TaxID=90732 RepID=A0A1H2GB90_9BACT|nr:MULTISPECIES: hypothetical protein [Desulfobacula]SDU16794.1 hypothetical protein SAMN04487931_105103 [Desulfobacula phenolica]
MKDKKKIDKERQMSYDSLPPSIKESLTEEEKEIFLYAEVWPDSLFEKLDEFIVKD